MKNNNSIEKDMTEKVLNQEQYYIETRYHSGWVKKDIFLAQTKSIKHMS